jgi:hypothetical protein
MKDGRRPDRREQSILPMLVERDVVGKQAQLPVSARPRTVIGRQKPDRVAQGINRILQSSHDQQGFRARRRGIIISEPHYIPMRKQRLG